MIREMMDVRYWQKGEQNRLGSTLTLLLALLLVFPLQSFAAVDTYVSRIQAPSDDFAIFSDFDPNHQYLESGHAALINEGNGIIRIIGNTKATGYIDRIGIKYTIQRWTGTNPVDIYTSPSFIDFDVWLLEVAPTSTVDTGYYYRIISTHWAQHSGVYEEGIKAGTWVYIN